MSDRPRRPRINFQAKMEGAVKVNDELEYKENKCTKQARYITPASGTIILDIYYDKHYILRKQEREGIRHEAVNKLIVESFGHLLFYAAHLEKFSFLNYGNPQGQQNKRILLQDSYTSEPILNVVVEIHFDNVDRYQLTVKTAMCADDFKMFDGGYILEMVGKDASELKRFVKNKQTVIAQCQT